MAAVPVHTGQKVADSPLAEIPSAEDSIAVADFAAVAEVPLRAEIACLDAAAPVPLADPVETAARGWGIAASVSSAAALARVAPDSESAAFGCRSRQLESALAARSASVELRQTYSSAEQNQIR